MLTTALTINAVKDPSAGLALLWFDLGPVSIGFTCLFSEVIGALSRISVGLGGACLLGIVICHPAYAATHQRVGTV